ncbi:MAG: methionine-R-sulfoxide reductase [Bacteroidota bacterium]
MKTKENWNPLTAEEEYVIALKGTERPYTGEYNNFKGDGIFVCRRCEAPLYDTSDKFDSGCGWPSFDDDPYGNVRRERDADGRRVEILCNNCGGHLGHVFEGERFTAKNTRHCVNSLSIKYIKREAWERRNKNQ